MAETIKEELNIEEFEIKEEIFSIKEEILPSSTVDDTSTEDTEIKGKHKIFESFIFSFKILNILHEYMKGKCGGLSVILENMLCIGAQPPPPSPIGK